MKVFKHIVKFLEIRSFLCFSCWVLKTLEYLQWQIVNKTIFLVPETTESLSTPRKPIQGLI